MEKQTNPVIDTELSILRVGIRTKYKEYQSANRDKFPDIEFNTNKANYEPLKASFEEEFYVVRRIDRAENNLHIPSTKTLALLFTDERYVPSKKILNTCRSYAEGKSTATVPADTAFTNATFRRLPGQMGIMMLAGLILLIGLGGYVFFQDYYVPRKASGLAIASPGNTESVSRLLPIEGRVVNADSVWIVVRPGGSPDYYVQTPVKVDARGHWKGLVIIGSTHKANSGVKFQIRAFVKPEQRIVLGDVLNEWPKAELTSSVVEVIRGNDINALPTDDVTIYQPFDGQTVPCKTFVAGKAVKADTIWVIIKSEGNSIFWVQSPIKVEKNGTWKGTVDIGEPGMVALHNKSLY